MTSAAIIDDLQARGLLEQSTDLDALKAFLATPRTLYCGFDPTADSLHVGNLMPLLTLRRYQQYGHTPIVLAGGATGLIGDPSGRTTERTLNTEDTVQTWTANIKKQASMFVSFEGTNAAIAVNNYDWLGKMNALAFLRDVGKHFSVNAMLAKDSVKSRIDREETGISYTEFSYGLLQAYDFLELSRKHDCFMQIGGSDQWGNITGGIPLIRKVDQKTAYAMTVPLVVKADGTKFGKSADGAIWLDSRKTSVFAFYQYWINTDDRDIGKFMLYFSFKPVNEIKAIIAEHEKAPHLRTAQKELAREFTQLVHGAHGLAMAERITNALFSGDISQLTADDFANIGADSIPTTQLENAAVSLVDILEKSGLATSRKMAKEFIGNKAVAVNGHVVEADGDLSSITPLHGRYYMIKRGKNNYHLVKVA